MRVPLSPCRPSRVLLLLCALACGCAHAYVLGGALRVPPRRAPPPRLAQQPQGSLQQNEEGELPPLPSPSPPLAPSPMRPAAEPGNPVIIALTGFFSSASGAIGGALSSAASEVAVYARAKASEAVEELKAVPARARDAAAAKAQAILDQIKAVPLRARDAAAAKAAEAANELKAMPGRAREAAISTAQEAVNELKAMPGRARDAAVTKAEEAVANAQAQAQQIADDVVVRPAHEALGWPALLVLVFVGRLARRASSSHTGLSRCAGGTGASSGGGEAEVGRRCCARKGDPLGNRRRRQGQDRDLHVQAARAAGCIACAEASDRQEQVRLIAQRRGHQRVRKPLVRRPTELPAG